MDRPLRPGPLADVDLHIAGEEGDILYGGSIIEVEFEKELQGGPAEHNDASEESLPATVTVEKHRLEIVEYGEPWNPLDSDL